MRKLKVTNPERMSAEYSCARLRFVIQAADKFKLRRIGPLDAWCIHLSPDSCHRIVPACSHIAKRQLKARNMLFRVWICLHSRWQSLTWRTPVFWVGFMLIVSGSGLCFNPCEPKGQSSITPRNMMRSNHATFLSHGEIWVWKGLISGEEKEAREVLRLNSSFWLARTTISG